ncbi:tRNA (N6-threonylcarbamoyladenosine(37)-N6)-methyltransferase TrmO [Aureimonas sp. AU4]|uniref:tRNA (N6-threonylcarbamoyladenosine(37)-N6)-methyltransferase TrmO n=1 Tax=Aureimonas sp. AU4 TaxID=1638163 RepID=UPI000AB2667E|nr:tRNA (N6-threonylcarbamoyladenosine(37)-N6)-methyltransferase TrmO [Aureimonas sp. AU4]
MREGELRFTVDPALRDDARLAFIGRLESPWRERGSCPRNMREARERAGAHTFRALIDLPFRTALQDLRAGDHVFLLTWLGKARRDLALQMPRHATAPRGTFSLRSPVRPNPIGLHLVKLVSIDGPGGSLEFDALDVLDGTPLLDIKPYLPSVDHAPRDAS